MNEVLTQWISKIPGVAEQGTLLVTVLSIVIIVLGAALSYFIVKRVLVYFINKLFSHTKSSLDDVFVKRRVFNRLAYIVPAWLIYKLVPSVLTDYPFLSKLVTTVVAIYLVLLVVMVIDSLINSLLDIYRTFPVSKRIPIQSFAQVAKLLVYFVALISIVSLVLGESPIKLFAGLGAMTAVLMLVFKDPILGFVAGLQLSYNKMVNIGDWVEIPQHNADGSILEIGLLARYAKVDYIKEYLENTKAEVASFNEKNIINKDSIINGKRITNVGTFRAYMQAYLNNHPDINHDMTVLVRQLAPTEAGLPLQIYAFSKEKDWVKYEVIQADIFDHLFAVAKEFDLNVFQKPSGNDFQMLTGDK